MFAYTVTRIIPNKYPELKNREPVSKEEDVRMVELMDEMVKEEKFGQYVWEVLLAYKDIGANIGCEEVSYDFDSDSIKCVLPILMPKDYFDEFSKEIKGVKITVTKREIGNEWWLWN